MSPIDLALLEEAVVSVVSPVMQEQTDPEPDGAARDRRGRIA